jgi:hypothetical protein
VSLNHHLIVLTIKRLVIPKSICLNLYLKLICFCARFRNIRIQAVSLSSDTKYGKTAVKFQRAFPIKTTQIHVFRTILCRRRDNFCFQPHSNHLRPRGAYSHPWARKLPNYLHCWLLGLCHSVVAHMAKDVSVLPAYRFFRNLSKYSADYMVLFILCYLFMYFRIEMWTRDLPNTMHQCYLLHNARLYDFTDKTFIFEVQPNVASLDIPL